MHDIDQDDETSFQMQDYDSINVRTVRFMTNVHQTAHTNIASDEISSYRKLQCLLTDVTISNQPGVSSTVRIKLDTGACGNLLPFNIYKKIHPQVSVKDLCKTVDKRVCLEAYNKSVIKQFGTCCLTVGHGKNAKLCYCYIVPDFCRPISGLNDVHSLSLVAIKSDVTDKWSADSLNQWALHPLLMQWRSNQVLFCQKSKLLMVGSRESSRVWEVTQWNLWTLFYQRTMYQCKSQHVEYQWQ